MGLKPRLWQYIARILMIIPLLLLFSAINAVPAVLASNPIEIKSFEVRTLDDKPIKNGPLSAGATYKILATLSVGPGIKDNGVLETRLSRSGDRYWTLIGTYGGINTINWQPGQSRIEFDASVQGNFQIEMQGQVPQDYTVRRLETGETLHKSNNISLLKLSFASGSLLDEKSLQVTDQTIDSYNQIAANLQTSLQKTNADIRYVNFIKSMMNVAQSDADAGYISKATNILQSMPSESDWIQPVGSSIYLWIVIAVIAVLALIFLILIFRLQNEKGFIKREIKSQAQQLALIEPKALRTGSNELAADIGKIKNYLYRIGGK